MFQGLTAKYDQQKLWIMNDKNPDIERAWVP